MGTPHDPLDEDLLMVKYLPHRIVNMRSDLQISERWLQEQIIDIPEMLGSA